jgi:ribonuclease HI
MASIIWSAATSLVHSSTTNNQAEYVGALEGLRADHKHPLEVISDSQLILRQLIKYSERRNGRLAALYAEARRLADRLRIHKWHHHLRAFNKMADAAANAAMDTRASSQVLKCVVDCGFTKQTVYNPDSASDKHTE